ncbi:MAG: alpha-glucosidase/alpha-galactosidase [Lachnospiraceae bacterium]|nr:alpha-glucosidase/alpha-galactosidase [Lachnospiraceae bacterium]
MSEKRENVTIAYIGGGSRNWAWTLMTDLALEESMSGCIRLYDINREAAKINETIGNHLTARPEAVGEWNYRAVDTLQDALTGADFVIVSILPGTFEEMRSDVHAPEEYGVYQSVGDTVGPGGFFRAMRTIPMFEEIGLAIKEYAPDAWVINYTNPMTICVKTLYTVFPQIKAVGCCHEVFGTQKLLIKVLKEAGIAEDAKREEIITNVVGINHFTWFTQASYRNVDLMPVYDKFVEKYLETGYIDEENKEWERDTFKFCERVKMDMFKRYGAIAAAGDRHLAEFMPEGYLDDKETVRDWMYSLTTVDWRVNDMKSKIARSKRLASGEEEIELKSSGEEGVAIMKAILGLGNLVTNVNFPNQGQITNLPVNAIVESNAVIGYDSVRPVFAGEVPTDVLPYMNEHVDMQENIVGIVLSKDKRAAKELFLKLPMLKKLSETEKADLFEKMFDGTKAYLDGWK